MPKFARSNRFVVRLAILLCIGLATIPFVVLGRTPTNEEGIPLGKLEHIWSQYGITPGSLQKPRAVDTDENGLVYVVDKTARIQVFDRKGKFIRGWKTPLHKNGKPTGLSFDLDGNLIVADTHYFRILFYTPEGKLLTEKTLGGTFGHEPGEFGLVTDAVVDSKGNLYVAEYGEFDRIQKFSPDGTFLFQWGGHGSEPGKFIRPQNMAVDEQDRIWVVDACNHRVQVFDATGDEAKLVKIWGEKGERAGQFIYPYDLIVLKDCVYICEFGNHRVQKLTHDGECLGIWGQQGREPGELYNPWAIARDRRGRIHVVDSSNHRVQRIRL